MPISICSSKTAPAAVLEGLYGEPYKIISRPIPVPSAYDALVHLSYSGICHGDVYSRDGGGPAPVSPLRPLTGGHEGIGIIVALGKELSHPQNGSPAFQIGDMVGIAWRSAVCGKCEACEIGAENHCIGQKVTGMHLDGTYQSYISFPIAHLVRIPTGLDLPSACPILCAGVTAYKALQLMKPVAGKWCVVVGAAGGLGHLAIQYAKRMGLQVLAIDGNHPEKRNFCLEMGADAFVDFTGGRSVDIVREQTNGGADYVLVLSPHQSCYDDAGAYIRFRGQIMAIGIGNAHMPLRPILKKDLTVRSHETGTREDIEEALRFTADQKVICKVEVVKMSDLNDALDRVKSGKVLGKLVLDLEYP